MKKETKFCIKNPIFTNKKKKFTDKWISPFSITKLISEKNSQNSNEKQENGG